MDDQLLVDSFQTLISLSSLPEDRKEYFLNNLEPEKLAKLPLEDLAELLSAMKEAVANKERQIALSDDPDELNDYLDAKEFFNELFYEAEVETLKDVGAINKKEEASLVAARSLLEKFAGAPNSSPS